MSKYDLSQGCKEIIPNEKEEKEYNCNTQHKAYDILHTP